TRRIRGVRGGVRLGRLLAVALRRNPRRRGEEIRQTLRHAPGDQNQVGHRHFPQPPPATPSKDAKHRTSRRNKNQFTYLTLGQRSCPNRGNFRWIEARVDGTGYSTFAPSGSVVPSNCSDQISCRNRRSDRNSAGGWAGRRVRMRTRSMQQKPNDGAEQGED